MLRAALAAAMLGLCLLSAPVSAGAPSPYPPSTLAPPAEAPPGAAGVVKIVYRSSRAEWKARLTGLAGRQWHSLRFAGGPELGSFRSRPSGKGSVRFRSDRLPSGVKVPINGRAVEVRRSGDGAVVLEGFLPGEDLSGGGGGGGGGGGDGGGGGGGGGEVPTTRLPGVDGVGPWTVAHETVLLPTASGGLAPNQSVVYYPTAGGGLLPPGETFPPVVLVHGFSARAVNHASTAETLATWGFVVLVGDHADPLLLPDHEKEVKTVLGYVDWLAAENGNASSKFFGALRTDRFGLAGHSLGGGAAVVAATRAATQGRVKAVVGMAPAGLTTGLFGSAILPDAGTGYWPATLVLSGTQDQIVAPSTSKAVYFDPAPAGRTFLRVDGWCHTGFGENIPFGDYNASTCVLPDEQLRGVREYMVPWFLFHLRDDARVTDYVDGTFAAEDPKVAASAR